MNKYITMLLLGVVAVAMLLVVLVHMNRDTDEPVLVAAPEAPAPAQTPSTPLETPQNAGALPATTPTPAQTTPEASQNNAESAQNTAGQPVAAPAQTTAAPAAQPAATPQAPASPAQPAQPAANATAAQPGGTPAQPAATATEPSPAATSTAQGKPATASVPAGSGSITDISLHFRDKGMYLSIEGDGPLPAKYFVLSQPERLVVDLPGTWKGLKTPSIPSNNLVKAVRVGRQGNADRLVLDLQAPITKHELKRLNDKKVELYFQQ